MFYNQWKVILMSYLRGIKMTVEETKYGWTFKMNPPCRVYSCANCPYRQGYCCYYGNKNYKSYLKGDVEWHQSNVIHVNGICMLKN